jgi:transposase-like protein
MIEARRQVGALLDINPSTLRSWVERDDIDHGDRDGATTAEAAEAAEIRRLRAENAELRRANEILKTASAFFAAAELDRRLR